jgi:voltage-gated potassium channel
MNSFQDSRRQLRTALIAVAVIVATGVIGYMLIEDLRWLDAIYLTVITLATIGYGDFTAQSDAGRVFTIFLVISGLGVFTFAIQAAFAFFVSPAMRVIRQRRKSERKIAHLKNHYIICGEGELVDKTIDSILHRVQLRRDLEREEIEQTLNTRLKRGFGSIDGALAGMTRKFVLRTLIPLRHSRKGMRTLIDLIVIVTKDPAYAQHLRDQRILTIEADSTDDSALRRAGLMRAQAMMVMLESDAEALLTILTARNRNVEISIIAASLEEELGYKMIRVGANNVLAPYDVAGQFLNNATLRPAVNDFFTSILGDHRAGMGVLQLALDAQSPWIGRRLGQLDLRGRFGSGVIGIRQDDGQFVYAPGDDYLLAEHEVLLTVTPAQYLSLIQQDCGPNATVLSIPNYQRLPLERPRPRSEQRYSMLEAESAVNSMAEHFVICGSGPVIRDAIDKLDPQRPFVILSDDGELCSTLLKEGFRVILGNPTREATLRRAGVDRALAIMVSMEDDTASVLTVLSCRVLSKRLLITATANHDEMIPKLERAGADRVLSPFRIAAQFVLLSTTRPVLSDFMQTVIFNQQLGVETTELYMQDNSPWIGKTIGQLLLWRIFRAGVLAVRHADGQFVYAPPESTIIGPHQVLIVTTPMSNADELRQIAHGSTNKRPKTLRREDVLKTGLWV